MKAFLMMKKAFVMNGGEKKPQKPQVSLFRAGQYIRGFARQAPPGPV
jgi:hypothetical protein